MEVFPYACEDIFQLPRAEKRRRSASDVDRVKRIESATIPLYLLEEGTEKIRDRGNGCRRIEVTVVTFAEAKGNVNVETGYFL